MAFDGIAISAIVNELQILISGRIDKITQPEKDEVVIAIRAKGANHRVLLSCNASYPRLHFTEKSKENPLVAPMFCMALRKHLQGGRIVSIVQLGLERIVHINIEAHNEMGDLTKKTLILEVMGRHSNIILIDGAGVIDSIKHISLGMSSRPVLPGRPYISPPMQDKKDPFELDEATFTKPFDYVGISKASAERIGESFSDFYEVMTDVKKANFTPFIYFSSKENPQTFGFFKREIFGQEHIQGFDSASRMVEFFYASKDTGDRIKQKSADLRKLVGNLIARAVKKADLQERTLQEIAGRDELRLFGELITANIYAIKQGDKAISVQNFYEENMPFVSIELNQQKNPAENAQIYFKKYSKQKRTAQALDVQMEQNAQELMYLEAVMQSIEQAENVADLAQIRAELAEEGFVKKRPQGSKKQQKESTSKPMRFLSEGYEILVGKNNKQNDELLRIADKDDIWLHTKNIPGSHVIVRTKGDEISQKTLEAAVNLAAYYSKGKESSMVAVDYCPRKNVKKPKSAKPGMVIYETYKTAFVTPDEGKVNELK